MLWQYVQACDRTIFMEYAVMMMSFFKICITCSLLPTPNNEKMIMFWIKIVIFYDFFEIIHAIIVIRYLKNKSQNMKKSLHDFLSYAESNIHSTRNNIFAIDIVREANSTLKFTNVLTILNKSCI